ncbi:MAG: VCBS repeat-containing protein, partial [Thermoanaerobaculia bacterium]
MKRFVPVLVLFALGSAVACSTAPSPPPAAGAGSTPASQPPPAPPAVQPTPASEPTKAPSKASNAIPPEEQAEAVEKSKKFEEILQAMSGVEKAEATAPHVDEIVTDPKTGQKQLRLPKTPSYYAVRGRLYLSIVRDSEGVPLLREDKDAWYVEPVRERPVSARARPTGDEPTPYRIVDVPLAETEIVTPAISKTTLHLVDRSEGLPTVGMWRENFDLGDLDGDGKPEIVSTPPRLSGRELQVFKFDGKRWAAPKLALENPELVAYEYGGLAVGDFDGDGRNDFVFGRHGGGPVIAFNKGKFHFKIESRNLPPQMSTRAMAVGDLDGDGKLDTIVESDESEYVIVKEAETRGNASARLPQKNGYVAGIDTRAFFNRGEKFVENHKGLDGSCFGY